MDRFELRKRLGVSEHSATYLAHDLDWKELVVLKLLEWPESFMSLARQYRDRNQSNHSSLVRTLEVIRLTSACVVPDGLSFRPTFAMVNEYCEGGNLDDWMRNHHRDEPALKFSWFSMIAKGLFHIHRNGLVHGNIKASKVVFKAGVPKLCGRMVLRGDGSQMVSQSPYFAPEARLEERETFTKSSDLFSMGILLVQLFTEPDEFAVWLNQERQYLPDTPDSPSYVRMPQTPTAPKIVLDLMEKLLRHSKETRFSWYFVLGSLYKPHPY